MRRLLIVVAFSLLLLLPVISCQCSSPSNIDESAVRAYADPATETTLQGLSENNLAKYTQYGNPEFKAAVTQEKLDETNAQINDQFGAYESKEFLRIEEQGGYILVHYKATYEKGKVGIRMVFDQDQLVAGQWFE
jgi:hypothetical protein